MFGKVLFSDEEKWLAEEALQNEPAFMERISKLPPIERKLIELRCRSRSSLFEISIYLMDRYKDIPGIITEPQVRKRLEQIIKKLSIPVAL